MPELKTIPQKNDLPRSDGLTVARCNHPSTDMAVAEIQAMRAAPIAEGDFADTFTLICERFDRNLSAPLLRQFHKTLSQNMGAEEFAAAYEDFWGTEMFFANVVPYFVNHAKRQRENGPDLIALGMAETYQRGRE